MQLRYVHNEVERNDVGEGGVTDVWSCARWSWRGWTGEAGG